MATINTRVATTGGSQVRGMEVRLGEGPNAGQVAALTLRERVGGEARLQQLQQRFELRLISRDGGQFLQLRQKTTFGALKALLSQSARIRQDQERQGAQALLKMLGSAGQAVAQRVDAGLKPVPMLAPAPTAPAAPAPILKAPVSPAPVSPAPASQAPVSPAPASRATMSPPRMAEVRATDAPLPASHASAMDPAKDQGVEKPLLIRKWEAVAARMSPMDLVAQMDPWDLSDLLTQGEITQKTYQDALDRLKERGRLPARDHAFHSKSLPTVIPDPADVDPEKLRARFVREKVQVELFKDLPMKHVFGLGLRGEISNRAYQQIYREKARDGKLDEQGKVVWKKLDAPVSAETKAQQLDLSMQVMFRKMERHAISMFKDHSLVDLSEARRKGTLSDIAYEAILESQKRRGVIDDTQFMLWKNG